jgi:hypothetical protein
MYKRYASSAAKIIRSRSRTRKERDATTTSSGGGNEADVPPVPLPKDDAQAAKVQVRIIYLWQEKTPANWISTGRCCTAYTSQGR